MNRCALNRRRLLGRTVAIAAALGLGGRLPAVAAQEATPAGGEWLAQWEPGQKATINGAVLYYEEHGDPAGQPVLLLHGAFGSTENWANLAPVLVAAGYRVIATDSRAQGRSAWGDAPITYEQMAADTLGLLDHLGIAKTDVVGWSQGAIIALDLAIHHPERLGRVVAYGAYFSPDGTRFVPSVQIQPFERFIADYRRLSPEPERFEELVGVLGALQKTSPNYGEAELGSISVPVLVLTGEADEGIKTEHTRQLAALIPESTLVLMPGTGHFAMFVQPAAFNQIVLEYLAGKTPATPTAGTPTA
jgi:pimeloyl-ACP methyl ester carboxylesterase